MKSRGLAVFVVLALCGCIGKPHQGLGEGIEPEAIDWSADPCQDLYRFACGNWDHWHDFYPDTSGRSRTIDRQSETDVMYQLVTGAATATTGAQATIRQYHQICQDSALETNVEAVFSELGAIDGIATAADLARVLARLHADGVAALFSLTAGAEPIHGDVNVLHLGLDGWSLPDPTQYADPELTKLYGDHIQALVQELWPAMRVPIDAAAVLRIEAMLATGSPTKEEAALPETSAHAIERSALERDAAAFSWGDYLTAAKVAPFTTLNLDHPRALDTLANLLAPRSLPQLKQYLAWRVFEAHGWAASRETAREEFAFHRHRLDGVESEASRDWECFFDATNWMEPLVAPLYVERRFSPAARAEATRLIESIRTVMAAHIASRPWLDESTRREALDKLAQVQARVGFPDVWPATDDYTIDDPNSFVITRIALHRRLRARNLALAGTPVDRTRFAMSPLAINAAYFPELNQIVFPAAILQVPFFAPGHATAVNLGSIGMVMGHELTHGFDDWGRHFDGQGGLRDWWTPAVSAEFNRRAQCLVDEYAGFQLASGGHVDGAFTLGENIADLGGLLLAHDAWKSTGEAEDNEAWLTRSQQFFVAFAQTWCGRTRDQAAQQLLLSDPHSPDRFRVNGTVANIPAFAEAFSCQTGAPLAPVNRCELW